MAWAGVVGDEVEQPAHARGERSPDEANERCVTAVPRLHLDEVLVVVTMMGRALVHRAEPDGVASERRDVIETIADSIERPAIERGGVARTSQAFARSCEPVDHDVV